MQLRFTSLTVVSSRRDFHPQECAHAGRTQQNGRCASDRPFLVNVFYFPSTFNTASVMAWAPVLIDGSGTGA